MKRSLTALYFIYLKSYPKNTHTKINLYIVKFTHPYK